MSRTRRRRQSMHRKSSENHHRDTKDTKTRASRSMLWVPCVLCVFVVVLHPFCCLEASAHVLHPHGHQWALGQAEAAQLVGDRMGAEGQLGTTAEEPDAVRAGKKRR